MRYEGFQLTSPFLGQCVCFRRCGHYLLLSGEGDVRNRLRACLLLGMEGAGSNVQELCVSASPHPPVQCRKPAVMYNPNPGHFHCLSSCVDTLSTFWDNIACYKTKSEHFLGLMNSAAKSTQNPQNPKPL